MRVDGIGAPAANLGADSRIKAAGESFQQLLDKAVASGEDRELKEAAKQFEALFMCQMFERMRDTVMRGGLFEESLSENIFQGLLDQEVSLQAADSGSLGLADMIYQQLKRK